MTRTVLQFPALAVALLSTAGAATVVKPPALNVIPQPVSVQMRSGAFRLRPGMSIVVTAGKPEARQVGVYLAKAVEAPTGWKWKIREAANPAARPGAIALELTKADLHREGYDLSITTHGIRIQANTAAGLFYGVQTLIQLLPPEIESATPQHAVWSAPCLHIVDYPRFAWRGLMLDVSRHFFPKEFVERYIDRMARAKLNVFHWHLVDDNGWRIEIKALPLLTQVGAWRAERLGHWGQSEPVKDDEPATYGGFYTQDDIREVVAYAKERFITVLPEIEMPGHSLAALAAYPEFSCTGGPFHVDPGTRFYGKIDNAFCPGNEKTFEFIDKVLTEVAGLFPSEYVHIGGDECYKGFWKTCEKCQRRMAEEHLASEEELQSYLVRRVEKILNSKGKKLIGWDEILQGGLAPNAAVMSWRGMEGGIAAAQMNHPVVMSPTGFVYVDYYQGDPALEPPAAGRLPLSTVYKFEPVPEGVDAKFILGGQANLWTEYVPNTRHAEYMTWPRAFALAETLWSPKATRNWDDFMRGTEAQFQRLDEAQVNYARSVYDVAITPARDSAGKLTLRMSSELSGTDIYYTIDGTNPDSFMLKYPGTPVIVPEEVYMVKAVAWRNGKPSGRVVSILMRDLIARLPRPRS